MGFLFEIVLIVGPILLGTYLSTIKKVTRKSRFIVWAIWNPGGPGLSF